MNDGYVLHCRIISFHSLFSCRILRWSSQELGSSVCWTIFTSQPAAEVTTTTTMTTLLHSTMRQRPRHAQTMPCLQSSSAYATFSLRLSRIAIWR